MKCYRIEVHQDHMTPVEVEASSEAEALELLMANAPEISVFDSTVTTVTYVFVYE